MGKYTEGKRYFEAQWIEASVFRLWKGQSSISHNLCGIYQLWISWDEA